MYFTKLTLEHKDMYRSYTAGYINAEASFTNIMMWDNSYFHGEYTITDNMLIIKYTNHRGQQRFSMPYGNGDAVAATQKLCQYCMSAGLDVEILDANSDYVDKIMQSALFKAECNQNRDYREYVYLTERLATLSGKELHSKKNHVNKFKNTYDYRFVPMDASITSNCLELANQWLDAKYNGNKEEYAKEIDSISIALNNFDYFGLFGGVIYIEDKIAAFTVGEKLTDDTALVHIEKADVSYKGAYATINYEFANMLKDKFKYLNREEDMGIEGLRKAKMSYKPEFLTDKFRCKIKEIK